MSREALIARARGLATRRAPDAIAPVRAIEEMLRERSAGELAILRRWDRDAVAVLELDEDRRTLRTIARGIVAGVGSARRVLGAVPTSSLPPAAIARLGDAVAFADVHAALAGHPLASAFLATDLFDVEHALARGFAARARSRDRALREYLAQTIDLGNLQAALALAVRGGELASSELFLEGGHRLGRAVFVAAAGSAEAARSRLAEAFAGTPLAAALFSAAPSAIDEAALSWQLATQRRFRLLEPLGLGPVVWLVLQRRDEGRRLRARAWGAVLGGAT